MAIYQIVRAELFCDGCDKFIAKVQSSDTFLQSIGTAKLWCEDCGGSSEDHEHPHEPFSAPGVEYPVEEEAVSKHP